MDYQYLIIGGGMAADAAVNGIRQVDPKGSIGLLSQEQYAPYNRPPLSKALWKGEPVESVWRKTPTGNLTLHTGVRAVAIDPDARRVSDDRGTNYGYEKLLLATGGSVRRLPSDGGSVIYFRTLDDFQKLKALSEKGTSFAVIGGGFIGSEIAAALAINGKKVTMVFPEKGIGARSYPLSLSAFLNDYYASKGVTVLANEGVKKVETKGRQIVVRTDKREITVDGVVAGIGIEPETTLARAAGLKVENGIHVDQFLAASKTGIYAAGDVANFFSQALGKRIRVEHEDAANSMGELAGKNMAGENVAYEHLPFFYSDLFDLGYEAVGELDPTLEVVEDWKEKFREGVVYYLEKGRVRGVLLWNTWGQVDSARRLIAEKGPLSAQDLEGKIRGE